MAAQYEYATVKMFNMICCRCGIPFGVPDEFDDRRRQDGKSFCCPRGHNQSYHDNETQRLKKQLAHEKKLREWAEQDARVAKAAESRANYRVRAMKGVITKQKKRAAAGVCPCCNRTFQNLARHMSTKHPDYAK